MPRGGFSPADIGKFTELAKHIAPVIELYRAQHVTHAVTQAYLGPRSAARVLSGQITRGHIETINAAILFSDIRGWTGLSAGLSPIRTVTLANRYFDIMGQAITRHGGEILKFMGDGLLAIFPDTDSAQACSNAMAAAKTAQTLGRDDASLGLSFGIAMHVGDVLYGNIGSEARLDFTVMGPAVNLAARLEALCVKYDQSIVFSKDFSHLLTQDTVWLGSERLKGLAEPQDVFTLPPG